MPLLTPYARSICRINWPKSRFHLSRTVNFVSHLHTQLQQWPHDTPPDASSTVQAWHQFDSRRQQWRPIDSSNTYDAVVKNPQQVEDKDNNSLVLVTWNVDAASQLPADRISAIVTKIASLRPRVDVIFFQEVSRIALRTLLKDERIRRVWVSSEADETAWGRRPFATMTLLSRTRFAHEDESSGRPRFGPVWRVKYPSRFERDALCCDISLPSPSSCSAESSSSPPSAGTRVRLVNVHLDSLPIQPSHRPGQISIVSSILRRAGHGLVAGDFNPVLPEDEALVRDNGLADAWLELHPNERGYTWGIDGEGESFPPNRLDKVAMVGLKARDMETLCPPRAVIGNARGGKESANRRGSGEGEEEESIPSSDHSGLRCCFELAVQGGAIPVWQSRAWIKGRGATVLP